jgi:2,3-bisphosphoglycerate-independent phosphoglycerate mutase
MTIADGSFFKNPALLEAIEYVKKFNSKLHLLGLLGAGGVHSNIEHLMALLHLASDQHIEKLYLHLFTDGRDSPPSSALIYLSKIEQEMAKFNIGKIATLCGRYYGMDRDNRWERTKIAYNLITAGVGKSFGNFSEAIKFSYAVGKTDEFVGPILLDKNGLIGDNDGVIFFNFRIDRPRQLTKALILPNFETLVIKSASFDPYAERYGVKLYQPPTISTTFKRDKILKNIFMVTMTDYEKGLPVKIAFPPEPVKIPLARILSENNLRQFHLAETEKERFVTYYFDGLREKPFPGEDQVEIKSPNVATYDLKPEMSAYELTAEALKKIDSREYDFSVINFANPDMVGHTGVISAGVKACEAVDDCLGKIVGNVLNQEGTCIITADHGNIEEMINLNTGEIDTEHSSNPVPFIIVSRSSSLTNQFLANGVLADVTPTVLQILNIEKPSLMTGRSLLRLN